MEVNGTPIEMKFGEMSLDDLVALHNEMCLTAKDFGLTAESVPSFENVTVAVAACERLHGQIEKARERAAAPPKKERARAKSRAKKAAKTTAEKSTSAVEAIAKASGAVVAGYTEPAKEKTVAKKAKKAKSVKKAAAKKANGGAPRAGKYPLDAKVTWVAKENPARKGSIFFDRMEKVRKATTGGKLVEAILKGGIPSGDIRLAADKEAVKVTGGTARA